MTDQTTKNQTTKHSPEKNDDQISEFLKVDSLLIFL